MRLPSRVPPGLVSRPATVPLLLAAGAFLLALLQRPGDAIADSRLALHLDPGGLLGDATSAWSSTGDLGHVASGLTAGYAFPAGPLFALGDALGLPEWLVHRLWLGALLALAAWGVVRLVDALVSPQRGSIHLVAGALYALSPYVVVAANRTSVVLVAYAAFPWLLALAHRGLREPVRWRWALAFALVLGAAGGTVHTGALAWVLLGVAVAIAWDLIAGGVGGAALLAWLGRTLAIAVVTCAWWVVPLLIQASAAVDPRAFAEPVQTLWSTTSASEVLRGLGLWTSYEGTGYGGTLRPTATHGPAYLFSVPVVLATLLVPAAALAAWAASARHRSAGLFLVLVLTGVATATAGFPDGTPVRDAFDEVLGAGAPLEGLRTTYAVLPLVALGLAGLGGLGVGRAERALAARDVPAVVRPGLAVVAAAVIALAAWPLVTGRAPDRQLAFDLPDHWKEVAATVDAAGDDSRALVLPGQAVPAHRWGQVGDPVLPALADRPVAVHGGLPRADPRAAELLAAVDGLVSQERLLPGQLAPLLDVLGVGDVVISRDGDRSRSGELGPVEVARTLGEQPVAGLAVPRPYGPVRALAPAAGRLAAPLRASAVEVREAATRGLVRVLPRGPVTVADGAARALTSLAAFGDLRPDRPLAYAPDLDREALAEAIRGGAEFVVADGARRRAHVPDRLRGNTGPVLAADVDVGQGGVRLDPFAVAPDGTAADDRPDTQTVAVLRGRGGVASVTAPSDPRGTQFPEHRPVAAIDGDPGTMWLADPALARSEHHLDVTFEEPRDVPRIALTPASDSRGVVRAVEVNGRRHAVRPGRNVLRTALRKVSRVRVAITEVDVPDRATPGAGGIRELEIPGVTVREVLRPPVVLEEALRGEDLTMSPLSYLLSRVTADAPALAQRQRGEPQAREARDAADPERRLSRLLHPPVARRYDVEAWVTIDPRASDRTLDRIASPAAAGLAARSSSRFEGRPRYRASGAFDGGLDRSWVGQWIAGRPAWISWRTPRTTAIERLRLVAPPARVRVPTRVRLTAEGGRSRVVPVRSDGFVRFPQAVRGRSFRLDIVDAAFRPGTPAAALRRRAVGIGELRGAGVDPVPARRSGRLSASCGAVELRTAGRTARLRIEPQERARFDAGQPLRAVGCGPVRLPDERLELSDPGRTPWRIDHLRLASAPTGGVTVAGIGGRVVEAGTLGRGERTGVRLEVEGPAWLVHGEAFDVGWRATCDGRDLGDPLPLLGYATGWRIESGCESVEFTFGPGGLQRAGLFVSGAGTLLVVLLLLLLARRRRVAATLAGQAVATTTVPSHLRPAPRGDLPGLGTLRGAGRTVRAYAAALGVLLVAVGVPIAHFVAGGSDPGGYDPTYVTDREVAHWLAVAGLALLAGALVATLRADRRTRRTG